MKYKYKGVSEVESPSKIINEENDTKIVKPGDIFESDTEINNPDFELLKEEAEEEKPNN